MKVTSEFWLSVLVAVAVIRQPVQGGNRLSSGLFVNGVIEALGSNVTEKAGSTVKSGSVMGSTLTVIFPALGEVPETVGVVETSSFVVVLSA